MRKVGGNMPRVAINKRKYMIADLPGWIAGRMRRKRMRQVDLAKQLDISQPALSARLLNENDVFTYGDLLILFKELDATDEEILRLMKL